MFVSPFCLDRWRIAVLGIVLGLCGCSSEMVRIEGVNYVEGFPTRGKIILIYHDNEQEGSLPETVFANDQGEFVFKRVRPVELTVGRTFGRTPPQTSKEIEMRTSHTRRLFPAAGETLRVSIGDGKGVIKGKVALPKGFGLGLQMLPQASGQLNSKTTEPVPPAGLSAEALENWKAAHAASEEGVAQRGTLQHYLFDVDTSGRFRLEGVSPGEYVLSVRLGDTNIFINEVLIGLAVTDVTVPELDKITEIDVGKVHFAEQKGPEIGTMAPAFNVSTVDGAPLSLADLAGKYVLLDFWATWCGPCVDEMPALKAIHEKFKEEPDFAMVGLSLDTDIETVRKFVADHGLNWKHGLLGDWEKTDLPRSYGVWGIPALFLIGPDGRVVDRNMDGARAMDAVATALAD